MNTNPNRDESRKEKTMNTWTRRVTLGALIVSNLALGASAAEPTNPTSTKVNYARPFEFPTRAALIPLPPGVIEPQGWLRDWCITARDGYTGHMDEISPEFKKAWAADYTIPSEKAAFWPKGGWPFEGGAYWFDGLVRMGYALHDEGLIAQAKKRMDVVADNMNDKGISFFWWLDRNNPVDVAAMSSTKSGESFQWGLWANGIFGRSFAAYCAATNDPKAIKALEMAYSGNREWTRLGFALVNPWPAYEAYTWSGNPEIKAALVDLYTKPGDAKLRDWKQRYRIRPKDGVVGGHGVASVESVGPWALGSLVTGDRSLYEAVVASLDQHFPHGIPRGAAETCTVNGYIWNQLLFLMIGGEGTVADRVEGVFFNAAAGTVSRDFTKHVYDLQANRYANSGKHDSYKRTHYPLCCTASINRFLGYFATHQWYATYDNGLVAALYGPCRLTALAGDGVPVEIVCKTDYPFDDRIEMTVKPAKEVAFPLSLRIPQWCDNATFALNGTHMPAVPDERGFVRIARTWKAGDRIELRFPMTVRVRNTERSGVISYGPLVFALPIPDTTDENTPDPAAQWNYALDVDPEKKGTDMSVERSPMPAKWNWPLASPLRISVPAVVLDSKPETRPAQGQTPVPAPTPVKITLIPFGCTRFRISIFPVTERVSKAAPEKAGTEKNTK